MFGYNDAHARLQPLLRALRAQRQCAAGAQPDQDTPDRQPPMYIVSADVSRAFDCVDVERLLRVTEPLLSSPEYLLVKHVEVGLQS